MKKKRKLKSKLSSVKEKPLWKDVVEKFPDLKIVINQGMSSPSERGKREIKTVSTGEKVTFRGGKRRTTQGKTKELETILNLRSSYWKKRGLRLNEGGEKNRGSAKAKRLKKKPDYFRDKSRARKSSPTTRGGEEF